MNLLGVAGLLHHPSVGLLSENSLKVAIESEKITRHKHEVSLMPIETIRYILEYSRLDLSEVDYILTNWDAGVLSNFFYLKQMANFVAQNCYPWPLLGMLFGISQISKKHGFLTLSPKDALPKIVHINHHLAHVGSCYTLSPFDEAAVAILDGSGEFECTSLYYCAGRKVHKLYSMNLPLDSIGHVYACGTQHLGFRMLEDEFKTMALAAYGNKYPPYQEFFRHLIATQPHGRYKVNRRFLGNYINNFYHFPTSVYSIIGIPRHPKEELSQRHCDFAFALQQRIEEVIIHVLRHLEKQTRSRRLCLAGGVALNCVANGRIQAETDFEDIFIQPASNDAGTSIGAAAYFSYHVLRKPRPICMQHTYLGPSFTNCEIETELRQAGILYKKIEQPEKRGAELLSNGKIIGWFQGAAEFGPRALGNRSILADPRDSTMKDRINRLKGRPSFLPFAPSILADHVENYFTHIRSSPFMLLAGAVIPHKQAHIPAVVHIDGTARAHTVEMKINPSYYKLIKEFWLRTDIPVVLNTSFNLTGEPIVIKPKDAIRCFFASSLDALIIGNFEIQKSMRSLTLKQEPNDDFGQP